MEKVKDKQQKVLPVAVVGMSCRFPDADNVDMFWQNLLNKIDSIVEIPVDRWPHQDYYDTDAATPDKTNQKHGGFLKDIHDFDPYFFGISPREAVDMNPAQKLMMELAWEAIESSNIVFDKIAGSNTAVYAASIWSDYEHFRRDRNAQITQHTSLGESLNIVANRISYFMGFRGPSVVLDTGCSSGLVAIDLACKALRDGTSEVAIAGAVNHLLSPQRYVSYTKFGALSPDGRSKAFDASANGFVRSEGGGVIVLKTLESAQKDNDNILAIIHGTVVNNNGYNDNLPATSIGGQIEMLQNAYNKSDVALENVRFIEAHGTGTKLGDPNEAIAIGEVLGGKKSSVDPLYLSSVKTNIGHTEGAAGLAGIIKVILALKNRLLPPNLHFNHPNQKIDFNKLNIKVPTEVVTLHADVPIVAGVNSFGWGGTNAHVVVEEYRNTTAIEEKDSINDMLVLPLSAKSEEALVSYVNAYNNYLSDKSNLLDVCATTSIVKPHLNYRHAFFASDKEDLLLQLNNFNQGKHIDSSIKQKIVFVFPGQGSQWIGMGKDLLETEQEFSKAIAACNAAYKKYVDWDLVEVLSTDKEHSRLNEIGVIQPAICAIQIAIARLWIKWGVMPDVVVGHSMGEVAAAHIAGAIDLDAVANIICTRSRLLTKVRGKGAMAVTELSVKEAELVVNEYDNRFSIAVSNSPKSTVLAGETDAITSVVNQLESKGLFARLVKVDVASHSEQMDAIKDELFEALKNIESNKCDIEIYSTVRNKKIEGTELLGSYWVDNLREPVQFSSVILQLLAEKYGIFHEISPHPVLTTAITENIEYAESEAIAIHSLYRDVNSHKELGKALCKLYNHGVNVNWQSVYTKCNRGITLPGYPWQRKTYLFKDRSNEIITGKNLHPLLGNYIQLAGKQNEHIWQTTLSQEKLAKFSNINALGYVDMAISLYFEMIMQACKKIFSENLFIIENTSIKAPLKVEELSVTLQTKLIVESNFIAEYSIHVLEQSKNFQGNTWKLLVDGGIILNNVFFPEGRKYNLTSNLRNVDIHEELDLYDKCESCNAQLNNLYESAKIICLKCKQMTVQSEITLSEDKLASQNSNRSLLISDCIDNLNKTILGLKKEYINGYANINSVYNVHIYRPVNKGDKLWQRTVIKPIIQNNTGNSKYVADTLVYSETGELVIKLGGIDIRVIGADKKQKEEKAVAEWLYQVNWKEIDLQLKTPVKARQKNGIWLVLCDDEYVSNQIEAQLKERNIEALFIQGRQILSRVREESWHKKSLYPVNFSSYKEMFEELKSNHVSVVGIMHCFGIGSIPSSPTFNAINIKSEQELSSISILHLVQNMAEAHLSQSPKLVIVSNGVHHVVSSDTELNIWHSPAWGISKVIADEYSEFRPTLYDLSYSIQAVEIETLCDDVFSANENYEVAIRGKKIFVSRLGRYNYSVIGQMPVQFKENATYLFTGFKGMGIPLIKWMFAKGARHFILVSRSGNVNNDTQLILNDLKKRGASIIIKPADVSDIVAMRKIITDIDQDMHPLKGIMHAAGIVEPQLLSDLNRVNMFRTLEPKMVGAWNLHKLTLGISLDFFVLFSSISSLIGVSGLSMHISASTFLDKLAQYRKLKGLNTLSVNWGVIQDYGVVSANKTLEQNASSEGMLPVSMTDAIPIFEKVFHAPVAQLSIAKLDVIQLQKFFPTLANSHYLEELLGTDNAETGITAFNICDEVSKAGSINEKLTIIENVLKTEVATIISAPVDKINNVMTYKGLGIDSLMAVQLRNILNKRFDLKLSVTAFWTYPTIKKYAAFILGELDSSLEEKSQSNEIEPWVQNVVEQKAEDLTTLFEKLNGMTNEELSDELDDLLDEF